MSLSYEMESLGNTFHLGLLASQTSALLKGSQGTPLSSLDLQILKEARQCLNDLFSGAQTLHSGHSAAGVTTQSIQSLGLAINPLQQVQQAFGAEHLTDETFISTLKEMRSALDGVVSSERLPAPSKPVEMTSLFFGYVADSLLSLLNLPHATESER